jgi:hypothetical protein
MSKETPKKVSRRQDSLEPKEEPTLKRELKSDSMNLKNKRSDVLLFK